MPKTLTGVLPCIDMRDSNSSFSGFASGGGTYPIAVLTPPERAEWDRREDKTLAELVDHDRAQGRNG